MVSPQLTSHGICVRVARSGSSPEVSVINLGRINKLFKTAYIVVSPQLTSWYIQSEIT